MKLDFQHIAVKSHVWLPLACTDRLIAVIDKTELDHVDVHVLQLGVSAELLSKPRCVKRRFKKFGFLKFALITKPSQLYMSTDTSCDLAKRALIYYNNIKFVKARINAHQEIKGHELCLSRRIT